MHEEEVHIWILFIVDSISSSPELILEFEKLVKIVHCYRYDDEYTRDFRIEDWLAQLAARDARFNAMVPYKKQTKKALGP